MPRDVSLLDSKYGNGGHKWVKQLVVKGSLNKRLVMQPPRQLGGFLNDWCSNVRVCVREG